jgi:hypothetical protein
MLSYFTLPNSSREDKGSPIGKMRLPAIVSGSSLPKNAAWG